MRVAVQISGELRTLSFCIPNLKKYIFDPLGSENVDIFLHTWHKDSDNVSAGHGEGIAALNPRSYFVEKYDSLLFLQDLPRSMTMFYSIARANECRKEYERITGTTYDVVIRYRTDCLFGENPLEPLEIYRSQASPFLVIPTTKRIPQCDGPADDTNIICDWFAYGSPNLMDIYCDTFRTWNTMGLYPIPESMLFLQLTMNGIHKNTWLKRPVLDIFLIEANGKIRGLEECVKEESKNS